jgi:hypothetical protein
MSDAFIVFLPACLASLTALVAMVSPFSSNTLAKASLASSFTLSAPAFFMILPIGAIGNSPLNDTISPPTACYNPFILWGR